MLVALLSVPLAGAGLLAVASARAARAIHAVTALLTALAALAVAAAAARPGSLSALDGVLRADALS